jgi:ergothioneine biosynthesis protein EgtB
MSTFAPAPGQAVTPPLSDREAILAWFDRSRQRSQSLFDLLGPDAYYARPIPLRHPVVFYEGHLAAFNVNTLVKRALGRPGVDSGLERLFARGIDPDDDRVAGSVSHGMWPPRERVRRFVEEADRLVRDALCSAPLDQPGHPLLDGGEAVYTILEHEAMHQETMLYMWHRLPYAQKRQPAGPALDVGASAAPPPRETVRVPDGKATLGTDRRRAPFGWDNELPPLVVAVGAFQIDVYDVTNADFMQFVEAGGYRDPRWWTPKAFEWITASAVRYPPFWRRSEDGVWLWHGMFEEVPLPRAWPVYVSHAEAEAFARWRGGRLPTEAEFQRAAYGTASGTERMFPWGDEPPDATRGNFDFARWEPEAVGRHPGGCSAWGIHDLVGNGWEWTSTVFAPFPGFRAMASYPEYSADFFDGQHRVMKGASQATARELLRPGFRNWFRTNYPYVYATFRLVHER